MSHPAPGLSILHNGRHPAIVLAFLTVVVMEVLLIAGVGLVVAVMLADLLRTVWRARRGLRKQRGRR